MKHHDPLPHRRISLLLLVSVFLLCLGGCAESIPADEPVSGWSYENEDLTEYIRLCSYKGLEYETGIAVTDEETVNGYIEMQVAKHAGLYPITDRVSQSGDYATISYTVWVDGEPIDSLAVSGFDLMIGDPAVSAAMSGLSEGLSGRKAGDTFTFEASFSEDYFLDGLPDSAKLAGKTAVFRVSVDKISEFVEFRLTDATVGQLSGTAKTVEEYREEVRAYLIRLNQTEIDNAAGDFLMAQIVEGSEVISYPQEVLEAEKETQRAGYLSYAEKNGMTLPELLSSDFGMTEAEFEEKLDVYAKDMIKKLLVMYAIANAENIRVTAEEYPALLSDYFAREGAGFASEAEFEAYHGKTAVLRSLLYEKVTAFLRESGKPVIK